MSAVSRVAAHYRLNLDEVVAFLETPVQKTAKNVVVSETVPAAVPNTNDVQDKPKRKYNRKPKDAVEAIISEMTELTVSADKPQDADKPKDADTKPQDTDKPKRKYNRKPKSEQPETSVETSVETSEGMAQATEGMTQVTEGKAQATEGKAQATEGKDNEKPKRKYTRKSKGDSAASSDTETVAPATEPETETKTTKSKAKPKTDDKPKKERKPKATSSKKDKADDAKTNMAELITNLTANAEAYIDENNTADIADDDDENTSVEVELITVNGKEFYLDATNMFVYDILTSQHVGIYNFNTKTITHDA